MNKVLEKIMPLLGKINERNVYYVLGVFVFIFFLMDFFLILSPQLGGFKKIDEKIKTAKEEYKAAKENIDKMAFYISENSKLKDKFDQMDARVKDREELPVILERISRLALKNNVKIDQITPDISKQKSLLKEKDRVYFALPIAIDAKSDYHGFGRFLNQIESDDDLFLMVSDLTIASHGDSRQHDI